MTLTDYKITDADYLGNDVASQPDKLTGTASENKAVFDRLVKQVVAIKLNQLIDALSSGGGSISGLDADKLDGQEGSYYLNRNGHTGTQSADTVTDGTLHKAYTAEEKAKLAGIKAGAEVNINADWNAASGDAQILNKPAIPDSASTVIVTLAATAWVGDSAPYTQVLTINGMTASKNGFMGIAQPATAAQREQARAAMLSVAAQNTNTITVTADGTKPMADIPVSLTVLG